MIRVEEMGTNEINSLLARVGYGHLGCNDESRPYVVPIHYAYREPDIYLFTTEGKKTEIIENNPQVCLQVEEIIDEKTWKSVIAEGIAVQLTEKEETDRAMELILATNPTLTPALNVRWMDQWIRSNVPVAYRITPTTTSGRTTVN